jgi:arabinofuranosyltransferase
MSVTFAIGGMETSIFILLLLGSLYMHSTHRPVAAALLAAISLITRPDALLGVLPLLMARVWTLRKKTAIQPSLTELLAFILPLAIWGIFGFLTYGSPIPQSISAKSVVYHLPRDASLIRLLQHFATPFQGNLLLGRFYTAFGLLFFPGAATLGWRRALQKRPNLWPLAAFPLLYFLVYSIANPLIFRWYLAPPLPFYILGITIGIEAISRDLSRPVLLWLISAILLGFTLNAWTMRLDHGPQRPAPKMAFIKLEEMYFQAAQDLIPDVQAETVIASGDIGALGYYSQSFILDMVGLITPEALDYFPIPLDRYVINYAIPADLVNAMQPDYVIFLEVYGRRTLLLDSDFQERYALIREYPTDIYGAEAMLVFARR